MQKRPLFWLVLIVLLGFALRFIGYYKGESFSYFKFGDEILAYDRAVDYAMGIKEASYLSQARFTPHSHTPGALWTVYWLNSMRLTGGHHSVALVTLILNTMGIVFVYLLGRRLLGTKGGLWAALLTATLPWAVYYSIGAYNPDLMFFFSSLTFLTLWISFREENSPHVFWAVLLPLTAMQFHTSATAMLTGVITALILTRKPIKWSALISGIFIGLLFYLPYLLNEAQNNWHNTKTMLIDSGEKFSFGCIKALTTPFTLLMSWCPRWTLPDFQDYLTMGNATFGSFMIMFAFKALGSVIVFYCLWHFFSTLVKLWRKTNRPDKTLRTFVALYPAQSFVVIFLVMPLLVFLLTGHNYASRYGIFQLPILVMLPVFCLVSDKTSKSLRKLLRYGMTITVIFNIYFLWAFFNYQGNLINSGPKFMPSFRHLARVYQTLKEDAGMTRSIVIDDFDFIQTNPKHDAEAIGMYVAAREKEAAMNGLLDSLPAKTYTLLKSSEDRQIYKIVWQYGNVMLIESVQND